MRAIRPLATSKHVKEKPFIFKDLSTSTPVFVRHDAVRKPLQPPFDGPFQVLQRSDKTYDVDIRGKKIYNLSSSSSSKARGEGVGYLGRGGGSL